MRPPVIVVNTSAQIEVLLRTRADKSTIRERLRIEGMSLKRDSNLMRAFDVEFWNCPPPTAIAAQSHFTRCTDKEIRLPVAAAVSITVAYTNGWANEDQP
jgi:hypothetical protein